MAQKADYVALSQELDEILLTLQSGEVDVDEAMRCYERGLELLDLLEKHLKEAENKVIKLKQRFDGVGE